MTDEEKFLIDRLADPLLRARDHAETLGMIAMAGIPAAVPALAAFASDSRRPMVLRRQAAAAIHSTGGGAPGSALALPELDALARGEPAPVVRGLAAPASDEEATGWVSVAAILRAPETLPVLALLLRDEARAHDVRRHAAETFRALTHADPQARQELRRAREGATPWAADLIDLATE